MDNPAQLLTQVGIMNKVRPTASAAPVHAFIHTSCRCGRQRWADHPLKFQSS